MWKGKTVSLVLPALDEAEGIEDALDAFRALGFLDELLVADNGSTDGTGRLALGCGARVVREEQRGYGFAVRAGLAAARGDLLLLCEPDGTFAAADAAVLLEPAGDFDLVLGSRTWPGLIADGANMGPPLRWGNRAAAKLLERMFRTPPLTDVGCSYRVIRRKALERLLPRFSVGGSHFLPEMTILAARRGLSIVEVPVRYLGRRGRSKITGSPWRAAWVGARMLGLMLRYAAVPA